MTTVVPGYPGITAISSSHLIKSRPLPGHTNKMVCSRLLKATVISVAAFLLFACPANAQPFCSLDQSNLCWGNANCNYFSDALTPAGFQCSCQDGLYGSGYVQQFLDDNSMTDDDEGCETEAAVVRVSILIGSEWDDKITLSFSGLGPRFKTSSDFSTARDWIIAEVFGGAAYKYHDAGGFVYRIDAEGVCVGNPGTKWFTANLLFKDLAAADAYLTANLQANISALADGPQQSPTGPFSGVNCLWGVCMRYSADVGNGATEVGTLATIPRAYSWTTETTGNPIQVAPTGLTVDTVDFKADCLTAGCWMVDVTYTRGENNANVFYLPRAHNDDSLSFDYDYINDSDNHNTYADKAWTLEDTFQPANFPCGSDNYNYNPDAGDPIQRTISACCIPEFIENYRALEGFSADARVGDNALTYKQLKDACVADMDNAPRVDLDNLWCDALSGSFHDPVDFEGRFADATASSDKYAYDNENMATSTVESLGVVDPYIGIYRARFLLDEVELRRYAGKLRGTVSVEHSVDFFVGMAEFRVTGNRAIDMAQRQVDIHVEKTDFFTVSTHGENAYTFLRYVNLRLVQVYDQDVDQTDDARTATFFRTTPTYTTQYVQVTFTLGPQYERKPGFDIIPTDSVRIGRGAFATEAQFAHACVDWFSPGAEEMGMTAADRTAFEEQLGQSCAPQSTMCQSPSSIPDAFVAFNVPAFDKAAQFGYFGATSPTLDNNIFIDLVVQVQNRDVMDGMGTTGNITKTVLKASIPVVEGGINIFCDAVGAKTDLKDVADVTIVIGHANDEQEFTRLRVLQNVASSTLQPQPSTQVDSDSIESALMTVVVLGSDDYFRDPFAHDGSAGADFGLELEDAITIHIMEDQLGLSDPFDASLVAGKVLALVNQEGDELFDANSQLQTGGYPLNGAFDLQIDRANNRGKLNPSAGLAGVGCAFAAQAPTAGSIIPTTCIIRRDVDGRNCLRKITGAEAVTASELPHCADAACDATLPPSSVGSESKCHPHLSPDAYMETVLGANDFAAGLGTNFAQVIAKKYKLNNRSRRAWFINPGYEWTATQTGGQSKFQVSQKIFLFALFGLNEGRGTEINAQRRRFLFQASDAGDGSTTGTTTVLGTQGSLSKALAAANGVGEGDVAQFAAEVALTAEEACMSDEDLKTSLRSTLDDAVSEKEVSNGVLAVQIHDVVRNLNGVQCSRRDSHSVSPATADLNLFVVFETEEDEPERWISVKQLEEDLGSRLSGITASNLAAEDIDCPTCDEDTGPGTGNKWIGQPAPSAAFKLATSALFGGVLAASALVFGGRFYYF